MPDSKELLDAETKSIADSETFSKLTVLGALHNLISVGFSILEDATDLLENCYKDREGLVELLSFTSNAALKCSIDTTFPNWYHQHKHLSTLNKIISFSKHFAKEGKIVKSLLFLLTLRKNFSLMFKTGQGTFLELQSCYEKVIHFEPCLIEPMPFFSPAIDTLMEWLENNQTTLRASENIAFVCESEEEDDDESDDESPTIFMKHLQAFQIDLKIRLQDTLLIHVDEEGRTLNLCPPYTKDPNRGAFLVEQYSTNPELKKKIDYLKHILGPKLIPYLTDIEEYFQLKIETAKNFDASLGTIKRVAYLSQGLDPRVHFSDGFCAGDSTHWCQTILDEHNHHIPAIRLDTEHNIPRKMIHREHITEAVYHLQMKNGITRYCPHDQRLSAEITDIESAQRFCIEILDALREKTNQNRTTISFEVDLYNNHKKSIGHQIAFCRFFREGTEIFRIRDVNVGEFEGSFLDLRSWYPKWYCVLYGISPSSMTRFPYDKAIIRAISKPLKQQDSINHNQHYSTLLIKNMQTYFYYSMVSDKLIEEHFKIYFILSAHTLKDKLLHIFMLLDRYHTQIHNAPKQMAIQLDSLLRLTEYLIPQCNILQTPIQMLQLLALFHDGQITAVKAQLLKILPSITVESLKHEDKLLIKLYRKTFEDYMKDIPTTEKITQLIQETVSNVKKTLHSARITIEKLLKELIENNLSDKSLIKRLIKLSETYLSRIAYIITSDELFQSMEHFKRTGLQEETMHPVIENAMDMFLSALTDKKHLAEEDEHLAFENHPNIASLTLTFVIPKTLTALKTHQDNPQFLLFMQHHNNKMQWKKWKKEYYTEDKGYPERKQHPGYGPGALIPFRHTA